jgi:hypothetical protein
MIAESRRLTFELKALQDDLRTFLPRTARETEFSRIDTRVHLIHQHYWSLREMLSELDDACRNARVVRDAPPNLPSLPETR